MKNKIFLSIVIITSLAILAYYFYPQIMGTIEAKKDLKNNSPKYLIYGKLAPFEKEASKLILMKYGIKIKRVAKEVIGYGQLKKCDAYNKTINIHFGFTENIFTKTVNSLLKKKANLNNILSMKLPTEIIKEFGEHPVAFFAISMSLFYKGKNDLAVFWFYIGQLRYRFYLQAKKDLDRTGEPNIFGALQMQCGDSINLYAGSDPKNWIEQIDNALKWDLANPNKFTSKKNHPKVFKATRDSLKKLKKYIHDNHDFILAERKQNGIGPIGLVNGVYVDHRNPLMPKDWPKLKVKTSLNMIIGTYENNFESLLSPILFSKDQHKTLSADRFIIKLVNKNRLLAIAMEDNKELLRKEIGVLHQNDAVITSVKTKAKDAGLIQGSKTQTTYFRMNIDGELVIKRKFITEGKSLEKGPIKTTFTIWNRAKKITTNSD